MWQESPVFEFIFLANSELVIPGGLNFSMCILFNSTQVALVYPNNEPVSFISAFYGCLTAGVVPVPIEVPLTKRVSANSSSWVCIFSRFISAFHCNIYYIKINFKFCTFLILNCMCLVLFLKFWLESIFVTSSELSLNIYPRWTSLYHRSRGT